MAISSDYPSPVQVNGFQCKNCTDVDYAKKHIDPAHPKSGPYGVNAATDPSQKSSVILGGALKGMDGGDEPAAPQDKPATGAQLDITV
jgi:hypothetical protein